MKKRRQTGKQEAVKTVPVPKLAEVQQQRLFSVKLSCSIELASPQWGSDVATLWGLWGVQNQQYGQGTRCTVKRKEDEHTWSHNTARCLCTFRPVSFVRLNSFFGLGLWRLGPRRSKTDLSSLNSGVYSRTVGVV